MAKKTKTAVVSGPRKPARSRNNDSGERNAPPRVAKGAGRRRGAKPAPWTFPKNPLEEAIGIAKAIEDKYGGNPMKADLVARAVGYNKPNDW